MKKFYFINLLLITGLLALNFNSIAQGYNVTLPVQYNTQASGQVEVLSFPGTTPNANGAGTLTIYYGQGDFSSAAANENLTMTGETGPAIGTTTVNRGDCNALFDSNVYTISMADINAWAATGGTIDISCAAGSGVNNFCSVGGGTGGSVAFGVYGKLTYPTVTGPNDAGASSISPSLVCAGTDSIKVVINNYGTNQVNPVTVNWMLNGVLQTPITYNSVLDTTGGTGSTSATVFLGTHNFTSTTTVTAWTSMPNSVADTSNLNDTAFLSVTPSLNGVYTINQFAPPVGNNYQTWNAALADLNAYGVCGPTVFNVAPGTYTGQIEIGAIAGISAVNTVTFNGMGASTILEHSPTGSADGDNCVVKFNGASYVTFNNFTINNTNTSGWNRVLSLLGSNSHITIKNNVMNGFKGTTTSNWASIIYNPNGVGTEFTTIDSNTLNNGSYSLYWFGGNTTTFEEGNMITNNTMNDFWYAGIWGYYQEKGSFSNNTILGDPGSTTSPYGIRSYYCNEMKINSNNINVNGTSTNYGIYAYRNYGTATSHVEIMNNMIQTGTKTSTSSHYGLYMYYGYYNDIYHNTVKVNQGGTNSTALYMSGTTSTAQGQNNVQNNIFTNYGNGYALYCANTGAASANFLTTLDYNAYEATTGNLFRYPTTNHTTFTAYQTSAGALSREANSLFGTPGFLTATDLHVQGPTGSNAGNNAVGVTIDIDGDARPLSPDVTVDMGADEFNVPACPAPGALSFISATSSTADITWVAGATDTGWIVEWGTPGFTPGTGTTQHSSNDTVTITGLMPKTTYDAYIRAICSAGDTSIYVGPLNFTTTCLSALSGVYTLDPSLPVSTTNYLTLQDFANDLITCGISGPVTLNTASGSGPYMMNELPAIPGASSTNTVTLNGNGTTINRGSKNYIVSLNATAHLTINDFMLINETPATPVWGIKLRGTADNISITNNTIDIGTVSTSSLNVGISASNSMTSAFTSGDNAINCTITGNTILGGYAGILMYGQSTTVNRTRGHTISNNTVSQNSTYGIYLYYCEDTDIDENDVSKDITQTSTWYGIRCYYFENMKIRKNRVHKTGTSSTVYPMYFFRSYSTATSKTEISNNIITDFNNTGTAYGIYFTSTTQHINIYHNTISIDRTGATGTSYCIYKSGTSSFIDMKNNIFNIVGTGTGQDWGAYWSGSVGTGSSADNNLFNITGPGTNYFGRWNSTTSRTTLAAWQTATGTTNSVSVDPILVTPSQTPLSVAADNGGTPIASVTTDHNGAARSATTPDFGAIEFTGVPGDISLDDVWLMEVNSCLNTNDTAYATIRNVVGSTIDFSVNNLTVNWAVTGPNNSVGTTTINSGTLAAGATMDVFATTIDMSTPGIYTVSGSISSNPVNASSANDTLLMHSTFDKKEIFSLSPKFDTVYIAGDSVKISTSSPFYPGGAFFISEVCHFAGASTGRPAGGKPSWLIADDYIEVTGIPGSDLSGYTYERWSSSSQTLTFTFGSGTILNSNGTAIIGGGTAFDPANNYYGAGGSTNTLGSSTTQGHVLKDPSGNVVDAVGYYNYNTFPAASGVTASDWATGFSHSSGTWGIRLTGADVNSATNWVIVSATNTQDPNQINAGVTAPAPATVSGLQWTDLTTSTALDTTPEIWVKGWTTNGTYPYEVSYVTPCGTIKDTSYISVFLRQFDTTVFTVCDTFFTPIGNVPHRLTGFYYDTTKSTSGFIYDSLIHVYDVTVNYSNTSTLNIAICDSLISPSGKSLKTSGTYLDTLTNSFGCDSVITINLTITTTTYIDSTTTVCDSMMWRGNMYYTSGLYSDTVFTASCDSIFRLNLTVNYTTRVTNNMFICDSLVSPSGKVWKTAGTYMDTIPNASGCDSIMTFNLTFGYISYSTNSATVCDSMRSPSGKYLWTTSGTYLDTIVNASGCDSAMTWNMTVNYSNTRTDNITLCPGKTHRVGPRVYSTAGTYRDVFPNFFGCDSIIITNLSYYAPATATLNYNFCEGDSVQVLGTWYYSATVVMDTIIAGSSNGCDSITTHNITTRTVSPRLNLGNDVVACLDGGVTIFASTAYDTYSWSDGGTTNVLSKTGAISGVGSTDYILTVTQASSGCTARDTVNITFNNCVGIGEIEADLNINMYPNPASDFVTIEIIDKYNQGNLKLEILNSIGQVVASQSIENSSQKVIMDVNNFSKGLYLVRVSSDRIYMTKKLLIQK